jgi:hypothetical protein
VAVITGNFSTCLFRVVFMVMSIFFLVGPQPLMSLGKFLDLANRQQIDDPSFFQARICVS